jgi:hypothetical protein
MLIFQLGHVFKFGFLQAKYGILAFGDLVSDKIDFYL